MKIFLLSLLLFVITGWLAWPYIEIRTAQLTNEIQQESQE